MSERLLQQDFVYGETDNEDVLRGLGEISGRLLDVGSGAGSWGPRLRAAGAGELVALDPSAEAIALAGESYDPCSARNGRGHRARAARRGAFRRDHRGRRARAPD